MVFKMGFTEEISCLSFGHSIFFGFELFRKLD